MSARCLSCRRAVEAGAAWFPRTRDRHANAQLYARTSAT
ncbi:hypothetical protein E1H18_1123 [Caulobacter sp. RHG1]|nr:hypothetical protein [Caulobacter sp. RHG1]